jgi:AraC-like DNA-binding protein
MNKKGLAAYVFIVFIFSLTCAAQSQKDIDSLLIKSENLVYTDPSKAAVLNDFIFKEAKSVTTRADALLYQAEAYTAQLKYYEALQKIIEAKDFNYKHNNVYCSVNISIHLSDIFRNINLPAQADEALQDALKLIPEDKGPEFTRVSILLLLEQSKTVSTKQKLDYLNKALTLFNKNKSRLQLGMGRKVQYSTGMAYLQNRQADVAKKYFTNLAGINLAPYATDVYTVLAQRQLGEIAFKEGDLDTAENLLRENSAAKNFPPIILLRNYELLSQLYSVKKNIPLFALNRELYIAKLNNLAPLEQSARVLAISFYENSRQKQSEDDRAAFRIKFWLMACLFIALLTGLYVYYAILKKRVKDRHQFLSQKKLLEDTIENMKTQYTEENAAVPFAISEKAEHAILDKLTAFETSELFTDQELSLKSLAKHLDTNTKYLSEIINSQKNKNFKTYINELRINHIVNKLKSSPEYRQYKTSHLANEAGFTSRSSFTIVFKSVTGLSPSVFIASLEDKPQ